MLGRVLRAVRVSHPRTTRHNDSTDQVESLLRGRRVQSVGRHGKFLVIGLDQGLTMVAHLGMSGRFRVSRSEEEKAPHTHAVFSLDDGTEVRFVDPRTFGFVAVYSEEDVGLSGLSRLGPDAWEGRPSVEELSAALSRRTAAIKALLLDQGPISGLGNIYADEALFHAGIHPLTPGGELDEPRIAALLEAIRTVLSVAIEHGGTSLDDLAYLLPDGRAGENLDKLAVYGRADLPCLVCGTPIEKVTVRARSTHFCPSCQAR